MDVSEITSASEPLRSVILSFCCVVIFSEKSSARNGSGQKLSERKYFVAVCKQREAADWCGFSIFSLDYHVEETCQTHV